MAIDNTLDNAYADCQNMASSHYENFPVASFLLPKHLRRPISAIYAFARTADDFADEGETDNDERLALLDDYHNILMQIKTHSLANDNPIFIALSDTIQQHDLDIQLFDDLLTAFKQDVTQQRYTSHIQVIHYCQHSANPVGRLLLQLHGHTDDLYFQQSDAICTALQLINFYQDVQDDYVQRNRIYLPQDDMTTQAVSEIDLGTETSTPNFANLMQQQYQRTTGFLHRGIPLGTHLNGRFGWEIRTTILAACTLLHTLKHRPSDQQLQRPHLSKWQLGKILLLSLNKKVFYQACLNRLV